MITRYSVQKERSVDLLSKPTISKQKTVTGIKSQSHVIAPSTANSGEMKDENVWAGYLMEL